MLGANLRARLGSKLETPVDPASLGVFRVLFGALLVTAVVRAWAKGSLFDSFVAPRYFFPYSGLEWIRPLPGHGMYGVYAAMGVLAALFMLGLFTRWVAVLLGALFTWAHLADKANYLNHYHQISLLLFVSAILPVGAAFSLDSLRRRGPRIAAVPAAYVHLLRFHVGVVYFFGGVAKLGGDWLFRGEPLGVWLRANQDFPVLGPLFQVAGAGLVLSWLGAAYDLSVPFLLLGKKTRPFALGLVVVFHVVTAGLFQIGMFPWVMIASSLIFLPPDWPRRLRDRLSRAPEDRARLSPPPVSREAVWPRWATPVLLGWVAFWAIVPLRFLAYPGPLLWTEDGYRFAWRVMLMEKTGFVEFFVEDPRTGQRQIARLRDELTPFQIKMMATQPDMMVSYARHLADRFAAAHGVRPRVLVESFVSVNGRKTARYVRPDVDLAAASDVWNHPLLADPPGDMVFAGQPSSEVSALAGPGSR